MSACTHLAEDRSTSKHYLAEDRSIVRNTIALHIMMMTSQRKTAPLWGIRLHTYAIYIYRYIERERETAEDRSILRNAIVYSQRVVGCLKQFSTNSMHPATWANFPVMSQPGARSTSSHAVRSWMAQQPPQHQYLIQVSPLEGIKPLLCLSFGMFLSAALLARPILNRKVLPKSCEVNT